MIQLRLIRTVRAVAYTEGRLFIDGEYFCDTLEPADFGTTTDTRLTSKVPWQGTNPPVP